MNSAASSLGRMKLLASSLLLFMAAVFVAAKYFESAHPEIAPLVAFSEAALIGALADWFAVVAIFRHPLGIPIPHTAIIPNNKERIAINLGEFIEKNFLSDTGEDHPAAMKLLEQISAWIRTEKNSSLVAERILGAGEAALSSLSDAQLESFLRDPLRTQFEKIDLSLQLSRILTTLLERNQEQLLLDEGLRMVETVLTQDNSWLHQTVVKTLPWFIPEFVSDRLSEEGVKKIVTVLGEIRQTPDHPARERFRNALQELAPRLREDPEYKDKLAALKNELLQSALVTGAAAEARSLIREAAEDIFRHRRAVLTLPLAAWLESQAEKLLADEQLRISLVQLIVKGLRTLVSRGSDKIAEGIAQTVRSWDSRTLVTKLEQQVGRDLQFVRINGTIVGGLVGLALYYISNLLQ